MAEKITIKHTGRLDSMLFDDYQYFYVSALRLVSYRQYWHEPLKNCSFFNLPDINNYGIENEFLKTCKEKFDDIVLPNQIESEFTFNLYSKILGLDMRVNYFYEKKSIQDIVDRRQYINSFCEYSVSHFENKSKRAHSKYNNKTLFLFTSIYTKQFFVKPINFIRKKEFESILNSLEGSTLKEDLVRYYKPFRENLYKRDKRFSYNMILPLTRFISLLRIK